MIDSPFVRKDPAFWPLVAILGVSAVGIAVLGVGFVLASVVLSGGQVTEDQRPDRSATVEWPIYQLPPAVTIAAAAVALVALVILAARTTVRTRGTLSTAFGWALAGMLGAGSFAVAFPDARVGASPIIPGVSDHAAAAAVFALAAVVSLIVQSRSGAATKTVRAAGLNPAFLPIVPPQGASLVPELDVQAPPMWRWTTHDGVPAIVPEEHRPAPLRIIVPRSAAAPASDPSATEAVVHGAPARREVVADASGGTIVRYRYASPSSGPDRIIEMHIAPTADRHELRAYIDCADLIAGSVRWSATAAAPARPRRWWARR